MSDDILYLSPPHVGAAERERLLEAFDSGWIAPLGPHVDAFEQAMAARIGVAETAALSSGTAALHLALELLGVGAGERVYVSDMTFVASANAVRYVGATPVFIDSETASWNVDPGLLADALERDARRNRLPRAVIVTDLFGQCADFDPIAAACARFQVPVIEDAAEAVGATYRDRPAGTLGELGVFSFNGNKIITTSGGGMLVARDPAVVARARWLATQAREPVAHYEHHTLGYNYRLSNLLAAVGLAQLAQLDGRIAARRHTNAVYRGALADLPGLDFLPEASWGRANCWLTCITIDAAAFGIDSRTLMRQLEARRIQCRPVWTPMHLQPLYAGCEHVGGEVCARLFADGLCLPSGSQMDDGDRRRVIDAIYEAQRGGEPA